MGIVMLCYAHACVRYTIKRYKNNGFVKGTFESPSTNATRITEYQHFVVYNVNDVIWDGPVDLSSEAF